MFATTFFLFSMSMNIFDFETANFNSNFDFNFNFDEISHVHESIQVNKNFNVNEIFETSDESKNETNFKNMIAIKLNDMHYLYALFFHFHFYANNFKSSQNDNKIKSRQNCSR